jgi:MarR family transcriptional regulator, organic hydroperoxide resistance regulator
MSQPRKKEDISRIVNSVRLIRNVLNCYSKELMRTCGLTGPQLGVLGIVELNPQISLGEVSDRMYLHTSTVSGIVDRLESAGYLVRLRCSEDRRVVSLQLTDKGIETISRAPRSSFGLMVQELDKLPGDELHRIRESLQTLSRMMRIEDLRDEKNLLDMDILDPEHTGE